MENKKYTIGMIGLGTMGCNLLLNIADHGFSAPDMIKVRIKFLHLIS